MPSKRITLTPGVRTGRLVLIELDMERTNSGGKKWICRCDCGVTKSIDAGNLASGGSQSCGCVAREAVIARCTSHGFAARSGRPEEYKTWKRIRQRCLNPSDRSYARYGERGITVCPEWNDFAAFYRDMGPRPSPQHSIDRIDNNGPYSPENCRWATLEEQANNKRNNVHLTHDGQTMTVPQWARLLGIPVGTLHDRIKRKWSTEEVLSPIRHTPGPKPKHRQ